MNTSLVPRAWRELPTPIVIVSLISVLATGCQSLRAYDGPERESRELAHIAGDLRITAGAPLSIILRRVDNETLGLRYSGVDVLPGTHTLLIDCTVTESKQTSRHHLDVDVDAGVKYRLVANTGPGNRQCVDVQLVSVN
jgi:hypothetical protein